MDLGNLSDWRVTHCFLGRGRKLHETFHRLTRLVWIPRADRVDSSVHEGFLNLEQAIGSRFIVLPGTHIAKFKQRTGKKLKDAADTFSKAFA